MQKAFLTDFASLWRLFYAAFIVATITSIQAAPGDLDPNFHGPTNAIPNSSITTVVAMTNGQFVVGGTFTTDFGLPTIVKTNLALFNADGSIDSNFQSPFVTLTTTTAIVGVGAQNEGKIVLSGNFTVAEPARTNWLRLNMDGSVDASFDAGARPPVAFSMQSDNKILVKNGLTRLNSDGSIDNDYQPTSASTSCSAVLPDQKIIIAGSFTSFGGFPRKGLVRLLPSGQVDETFAPADGPAAPGVTLIVPFKTNIWIAGGFRMFGTNSVGGLARLSAEGQFDKSFAFPAIGLPPTISQIIPLEDGGVIVIGSFTQILGINRPGIARLLANGSVDQTFNPAVSLVRSVAVQSNGNYLIAGGFTSANKVPASGIAGLLGSSSPEPIQFTTLPQSINASVGDEVSLQALARGVPPPHYQWFFNDEPIPNATNATLRYRTVSLAQAGQYSVTATNDASSAQLPSVALTLTDIPTPAGSIDRTFALRFGADRRVNQIVIQPDDRILVCGNFTRIDNRPAPGLARLMSDGSFDPSFASNLSSLGSVVVNAVAVRADGKIVVGGLFNTKTNVIRLNSDGSLDLVMRPPQFSIPGMAFSVAVAPDQTIIAASSPTLTFYDSNGNGQSDGPYHFGTNANSIFMTRDAYYLGGFILMRRTFPNFSIDDSLFYRSEATIEAFGLQTDGGLLVGGTFQFPELQEGVTRHGVFRVDRNGKLDQSFDAHLPENASVRAIVVQSDDRAIIAGSTSQLRRLNLTGETDPTFNPTFDGNFNTLCLTRDGKLLVGGSFTTVNGESRPNIVRLTLGEKTAPRLVFTNVDQTLTRGAELILRAPAEAFPPPNYTWMLNGAVIASETNPVLHRINLFPTEAGQYSVIVSNSEGSVTNTFTVAVGDAPTTPGSVDLSWFNGPGFNGSVNAFAGTPDGKLIVGGDFFALNGEVRRYCARFNADHTVDDTFVTGPSFTNGPDGPVSGLISLADESFLVAGSFSGWNREFHRGLAHIGTNNLPATNFFSDAGFADVRPGEFRPVVSRIALQGSSNIIAGGLFLTCNGLNLPGVARIQLDGSLNTNFVTGDFGPIYAVAAQADQKIWVGGTNLVRLNADGSTDVTLPWAASTNEAVKAILIQPDGKILAAGVRVSGHSLIRLSPDASLDPTFTPLDLNTNISDAGVYALELQADGKIIVGGKFTTAAGVSAANIIRLNPNGAIDATFKAELTFGGEAGLASVTALRLSGDRMLFVGGIFDNANGIPRYGATALDIGATDTPPPVPPTLHLTSEGSVLTITFFPQAGVNYTVESAEVVDSSNWQPVANAPHNSGIVQANITASNQFFRVVARP
jgi:uncharacterized delta-60 repeat protein